MNHEQDKISSYFTSPYFIGIIVFLALICAYFGLDLAFGYLVFIALLSLFAFLWGKLSSYGITVNIDAESYHLYPSQEVQLSFTLKNNKLLPLIWLEWRQPYPKNNCFDIPSDFEVGENSYMEEDRLRIEQVLCKRFSFIKWYSTVSWKTTFHAARRGVYVPNPIEIETGDGFGLSVNKKQYELPSPPVFVVYPKKVSVYTDLFFKNTWSASTGPYGVIEDVTVLKSTRTYEKNDPFKRINWRLAARTDELLVNIYDTISPRSVYFFLDTTTFFEVSEDHSEFEDTLSVIASLIDELFSKGMSVGLYLPNTSTDYSSVEDCLLALSLANCDHADAQFSRQRCAQLLSTQSGVIYYVCYNMERSRCINLFEEVGISKFSILSYCELQSNETNVHLISNLKAR